MLGTAPDGWREEELADVCEYVTVGHVGPMAKEYVGEGIPFLRSQNIQPFRLDLGSIKYINTTFHEKLKKSALRPGDVVIVRTGYPGTASVIPQSLPNANCADLVIVRPSEQLDPWFLASIFNSTWGKDAVGGSLVGVAQQHFNVGTAKKLRIFLPPLSTQRRIAAILSAYDDLIENNTRRIAILEEMVRRLYEEWFVHFRFPGHGGVKMVESEIGPVPEGWEVGSLGDVLTTLESGSRPRGGIDPNEREIPSIGAENINGLGNYDYSKEKFISLEFFEGMRRGHVRNGDVLLYKDGAHIGRKSYFRDGYPHATCAINEHVFILRPDERLTPTWLYFWLDTPQMTEKIRTINANAAQPGINQRGVKGLPVLLPARSLLAQFEDVVEPLISLLFNLAKRKPILQTTRDLLLPKLVSGEIDVSEVGEQMAEAAAE